MYLRYAALALICLCANICKEYLREDLKNWLLPPGKWDWASGVGGRHYTLFLFLCFFTHVSVWLQKKRKDKNIKPTNQNTQHSSLTCLICTGICIYSNFHGHVSIVFGCLISHGFSYINWCRVIKLNHFSHIFLISSAKEQNPPKFWNKLYLM